jgi:hypothetical protein
LRADGIGEKIGGLGRSVTLDDVLVSAIKTGTRRS